MNSNNIINEIKKAFSNVLLGQGIGLWEAQAIDEYKSDIEQKKMRDKDEKKDWNLIPYADLQQCHSSLSFFDALGMRFHIPAFIIGNMLDKVDDPLFHLVQLDDYTISKLTELNHSQKQAIINYLYWCLNSEKSSLDHIVIKRAIYEYWED